MSSIPQERVNARLAYVEARIRQLNEVLDTVQLSRPATRAAHDELVSAYMTREHIRRRLELMAASENA